MTKKKEALLRKIFYVAIEKTSREFNFQILELRKLVIESSFGNIEKLQELEG